MLKRFFIIIIITTLVACGAGDDGSNYDRLGANGLPASLSIFPHIDQIKNTKGKTATAELIHMSMTLDSAGIDTEGFVKSLLAKGFQEVVPGWRYINYKTNSQADVYTGSVNTDISLIVSGPATGSPIEVFYSYFPPIPGDKKLIMLNYSSLDEDSINAYISKLEAIGFQKNKVDEYWYGDYCFAVKGNNTYGYDLVVSNQGSGFLYPSAE